MTKKLTFAGIVQGIGFRPACKRLALELNIRGQVKNSGGNVELIIEGNKEALDTFVQRLNDIFEIKKYTVAVLEDTGFDSFNIVHSSFDSGTPFLTPDIATCAECEAELRDSNNRRYRHPFISCVNCGPRYTIMNTLPYDRENITMAPFAMCSACAEEYKSTNDRRCHAQTIACNTCGPRITMRIDEAVSRLRNGEIIAVKGIGGYHLACRADCSDSVTRLRLIKGRETKPFAVMFRSLEQIKDYCKVSHPEAQLLCSEAKPIVLLEKIRDFDKSVCGDSDYIGAFLPCNPIQIMLLDAVSPLVMTSANISGDPIITSDSEITRLNVPVLAHDREILTPLDDSVVQINAGRVQLIRRSRGYVPLAIDIGLKASCDTLAMGSDLKAVFGFHRDNYVFLSQYFGDLENSSVYTAYKENIARFSALHGFKAEKIITDKHPAYFSGTVYKSDKRIQHHKAHLASVIAEHRLSAEVLGFIFDGTGYGDDGAVWGGEVILFDGKDFVRKEHLEYTKMLASDEVSKDADLALSCYIGGNALVDSAVSHGINTVSSSSIGRLFDAVSALLDIKHYNTYEGECATALEAAAKRAKRAYPLTPSLSPAKILDEIRLAKLTTPSEELALGFHIMLSRLILEIAKKHGVKQIALSGGVFCNRVLTENTISLLEENGFLVYTNEKVPCSDGGLALGQAYISALEG